MLLHRKGSCPLLVQSGHQPADNPAESVENDPLQISRDQRYSVQEGIWKMTVGASLYEPINVFKPMGPDIGIVDGPFEYLTVGGVTLPLPFTTRMTVVRLCRYCCSSERPKQYSQKSTLGDRSALCSAMAGVLSLMATKSSGGYLECRHLESKTHSAAPRANFRLWPQAAAGGLLFR